MFRKKKLRCDDDPKTFSLETLEGLRADLLTKVQVLSAELARRYQALAARDCEVPNSGEDRRILREEAARIETFNDLIRAELSRQIGDENSAQ